MYTLHTCCLCLFYVIFVRAVYSMLSLYVQCHKWFFNSKHAYSISCHNVTFIFVFCSFCLWPLTWAVISEVSIRFRSESLPIGYILFRIYNNGLQFWLLVWQQSAWPLFFILIFWFLICLQYFYFGVGNGVYGIPLCCSKPDIILSTTPLKLASIFVLYFVWKLFAEQNWPLCVHIISCTVLYSYLVPAWPHYSQPITEELNESLQPITGLKICSERSREQTKWLIGPKI